MRLLLILLIMWCETVGASQNIFEMRRGAQIFIENCAGCHTLKYLDTERMIQDLQFKQELPQTLFKSGIDEIDAVHWFGQKVPDLSLTARARGKQWLSAYLQSFYTDPTRPFGVNNLIFPQVNMPHVLASLQGVVERTPSGS